MAEKEERIWIDYPLPKNTGAIEARRCTTMTRQEAIKKIETHLKASTIKFSTTPDVVAEIAINALLEG